MIIKVKVRPSSGKQEIKKKDDFYNVRLKSPPENNKANLELINLLKKYFGKEIRIKGGKSSRTKYLEIKDE